MPILIQETFVNQDRNVQMPNVKWERSWSFPAEYGFHEAKALMADEPGRFKYRVKAVSVPYRRHAAVSQLELRGAMAMLESAMKRVAGLPEFDTYSILYDARLAVRRQLEKL
jgi:hypothetical protein